MENAEKRDVKKHLLNLIPQDGEPKGNKSLILELKKELQKQLKITISEEEFWDVRNELIEEGVLTRGRGKGGSTKLLRPKIKVPEQKIKPNIIREKFLYDPLIETIKTYWLPEQGIEHFIIEKTAKGHQRDSGGPWTRPDIAVVASKTYPYIPGKQLEIITFEVKPADDYGVSSVFETASHSYFANHSYLIIHVIEGYTKDEIFLRLRRLCERFEVGLITFNDPHDIDTFNTLVESVRKNPDPSDVSNFIITQIKNKTNEKKLYDIVR